jgi:hypothetical protein
MLRTAAIADATSNWDFFIGLSFAVWQQNPDAS